MDPEHRPSKIASARLVALVKRDIDAQTEDDREEVVADLFWTAWPTVLSQDQ